MTAPTMQALILAAGSSKRFKTTKTKLLEKICGQEMILYLTTLMEYLKIPTTVVVGHQKDELQTLIRQRHGETISFVVQSEQRGTGDAVRCTRNIWHADTIIIAHGDVPLLTTAIIEELAAAHQKTEASITFAVSHNSDPGLEGYGRVVKDGPFLRIVEAKDFQGDINEQCCINAGLYLIKRKFLETTISMLNNNNAAREFYLTDLIELASKQHSAQMVHVPFDHIRGVNTLKELWVVEQIKRSELISKHMDSGVRFHSPQMTHVDIDISIGAGSYIGCGVHLTKGTKIGTSCTIHDYAILTNTMLEDNVTVLSHSVITDATIATGAQIGPFAHVEGNSIVGPQSVIGNFVQVKRSILGDHTKAKHLTFLGDARIGDQVNIGGGTIVCNYDGYKKHITTIESQVSVGSLNALVAPVTLEKNSMTGAGSVITQQVPAGALAIARARQINKEGYVLKRKQKQEQAPDENAFHAALKTENSTPEQP
jgi:bifunctional UDP-N-acetylglucosamine pyrophosphorylase / glucosamine-1-phosphate N-acetyltransferase